MASLRADLPRSLLLQHDLFLLTLDGRLLTAPVESPIKRVLDIGTGCGIWAAGFATAHPDTIVLGTDLFPPSVNAPPNCSWLIQDAEQDWDLGSTRFDVIHTRLIPWHASALPGVLRRCYEHLRPGGYVEMHEMWPPSRTDEPVGAPEHASKVMEWTALRWRAALALGIDQSITGRMPEALAEAGFVDVQVQDVKWPVGPWMEGEKMKEIGEMHRELLQLVKMDASRELLTHVGLARDEIERLVDQVGKELGIGKIYTPVRIMYARKPM